jgi:hypothetical protein
MCASATSRSVRMRCRNRLNWRAAMNHVVSSKLSDFTLRIGVSETL